MAINRKEIENKKYNGMNLLSFEYTVKDLQGPHGESQEMRVWFEKVNPADYGMMTNSPVYKIFTIINDIVYQKVFAMPKAGMPLEMVVATGLNMLRLVFQEEAAYKEMLNYTIADIIKDM